MRSEDQIKRKRNELLAQRSLLEERASSAPETAGELEPRLRALDDMVMLLDWVLNEPTGACHGS